MLILGNCLTKTFVQVNLFQKGSFLHEFSHNMTIDRSLIYDFLPRKIQVQNKLSTYVQKLVFALAFKTIFVYNMF